LSCEAVLNLFEALQPGKSQGNSAPGDASACSAGIAGELSWSETVSRTESI